MKENREKIAADIKEPPELEDLDEIAELMAAAPRFEKEVKHDTTES